MKAWLMRLAVVWLLVVPCWAQITIQGGSSQLATKLNQNHSKLNLDFIMTPEESARLLSAVDTVVDFDSKLTGLPVRGAVERQLTDRSQVKRDFARRLQDDDIPRQMKRSSLVWKKFGFLPRDFDLQRTAVETTADSLAGYYDPRTKTIYLLSWLPARLQMPVMAHELDHALQDQNFGLEKWMKVEEKAGKSLPEIDVDDQKMARRAVVEGHATAVMFDYALAPQGKSLAKLPPIPESALLKLVPAHFGFDEQRAPLFLRESAAFPYTYGMEFIHEVMLKAGKERAYTGVFKSPPRSTRQIMEPATYLAGENIPPLKLPSTEALLGPEYETLDVGTMSEFEVMVFAKQFGNPEHARQIASQWRGGSYCVAHHLSRAGAQPSPAGSSTGAPVSSKEIPSRTDEVQLVYVSRWASPAAARMFAELYRSSISQRYSGAQPRPADQASSRSGDVGAWDTFEGLVLLQVSGDLVAAVESFDQASATRLITALFAENR